MRWLYAGSPNRHGTAQPAIAIDWPERYGKRLVATLFA